MNLKDAFAGMKAAAEPFKSSPQPEPKAVAKKQPAKTVMRPAYQKLAKSVDPEYEPAKIFLRKATRRKAWRRWEDEGGGDFSDLVQHLLEKYLGT